MKNTYFLDKEKTKKLILHQGFNFKVSKAVYNDREVAIDGNSLKKKGVIVKLDEDNSLRVYWGQSPHNPMQKLVNFELNKKNINNTVYADLKEQHAQGILGFVGGITLAMGFLLDFNIYTIAIGGVFLGLYFWSRKNLENKLPYKIGFILYLLDILLWLVFVLPQTFSGTPNIVPILVKGTFLFMLYKGAFGKSEEA